LVLLPDAPQYAVHHPTLHHLIESAKWCPLCGFLNYSIRQGSAELAELWDADDPILHDYSNLIVTVETKSCAHHSRIVATVGDPSIARWQGKPLVWTTDSRLGAAKDRFIWLDWHVRKTLHPRIRLDVIKKWLSECVASHPQCQRLPNQRPPPLPSRVLQISRTEGPELYDLKLHISNGEHGQYIALSHCWGSTAPLKTLRASLAARQKSIPFSSLPLTFQDAVVFTNEVGCAYLWIDSLCIVQDDQKDWEIEAARMAMVYANAMITFAATNAEDASEGCGTWPISPFIIRSTNNQTRIRLEEHPFLDRPNAPLNLRAWAFQEALLSPRMVCFDKSQMFWKCSSKHASEDGLFIDTDPGSGTGDRVANLRVWLRKHDNATLKHAIWYRIIEMYSRRRLTRESDRIAALAGILHEYKDLVGGQPVAGLWREDLAHGLLWRTPRFTKRVAGLGMMPSWSWASVNGEVSWPHRQEGTRHSFSRHKLDIISVRVDWTGPATTSKVCEANLTLRGRLVAARLGKQSLGADANSYEVLAYNQSTTGMGYAVSAEDQNDPDIEERQTKEELGYGWLDEKMPEGTPIWCLEAYSCCRTPMDGLERNEMHRILLLVRVDEQRQQFKRIGVGELWRNSYRQDNHMGTPARETMKDIEAQIISIL
ncbi:hypothetical protein KXW70_006471, partial [Aspergillus fumigatus]